MFVSIDGDNKKHNVKIFTLSTCGWCRKTKKLLKDMNIAFEYVDVDMLSGKEKRETLKEMKQYNPKRSFPMIIIDGNVVVGYHPDDILKLLQEGEE